MNEASVGLQSKDFDIPQSIQDANQAKANTDATTNGQTNNSKGTTDTNNQTTNNPNSTNNSTNGTPTVPNQTQNPGK